VTDDDRGGDWARYWRAGSVEAMHAHFRSHVYHRHSHETYSFGVTDDGAQAFTCRGGHHVSTANMVMLFNPDDPHDGHAASGPGFTYRMIHVAPDLVGELLQNAGARPLFPAPVVDDPALARHLRQLHNALTSSPAPRHQPEPPQPSTALQQHEHLTAIVQLLTRHATQAIRATLSSPSAPASILIASRVRDLLHDGYAGSLTADDLAVAAGCSRYTATRAFSTVYGLAPSDYQRQLRLRAARGLLTRGATAAEAAATAGFADQAHMTRWFRRYYGVTPGVYRQAVGTR
jgi:AraC-like DNA-binding protein